MCGGWGEAVVGVWGVALCAADLKWGEAETMAMKKTCPASGAGVERDSIYFPRLRSPQNGARRQSGCGGERDVKQESTAADPSVVAEAVERLSCSFFSCFFFLWLLQFQLLPRCCRTISSWSSVLGWPVPLKKQTKYFNATRYN